MQPGFGWKTPAALIATMGIGVCVLLPALLTSSQLASPTPLFHAVTHIKLLARDHVGLSLRVPLVSPPPRAVTPKLRHPAGFSGPSPNPHPSSANAPFPFAILASRARRGILDHPRRKRILHEIQEHPGITYTELGRDLGIARGVLAFHLRCLEKDGLVRHRILNHGRYFQVPGAREPPSVLTLTTRKRQVLATIRTTPALTESELAKELRLSPRTMGYHLRNLRALGLVFSVHVRHRLVWLAARENRNYSIPDHKTYPPVEAVRLRRETDVPRGGPFLPAPMP